jgi:hypothetical protein
MAVRKQAAYSLRKGLGIVGCWAVDPFSGKCTLALDLSVSFSQLRWGAGFAFRDRTGCADA